MYCLTHIFLDELPNSHIFFLSITSPNLNISSEYRVLLSHFQEKSAFFLRFNLKLYFQEISCASALLNNFQTLDDFRIISCITLVTVIHIIAEEGFKLFHKCADRSVMSPLEEDLHHSGFQLK